MRHPLLAAALLALPLSALADGFSYTYADARYAFSDSDAVSVQFDGPALSGAYALPDDLVGFPGLYVSGGFAFQQSDTFSDGTSSGEAQGWSGNLRIGAHHALTPTLDVLANAGAAYGKIKGKGGFSGFSDDEVSYVVAGGLRAQVIAGLELEAGYEYSGLFDADASFLVGAEYRFTPNFSAVADARYAGSADQYSVGGRYNF